MSSAAAFPFRGHNMDEHATDRAPGTRVGQRHFLEPSIAGTSAPTAAAPPEAQGLYDPQHEKDACGVGFVVHLKGKASRSIVAQGLELLHNLEHRGACGCEANTGDGAGIMVQIPDRFLRKVTAPLGITLPEKGRYGTGLVFLPHDAAHRDDLIARFEALVRDEDQVVLGWRDVPTDDSTLGDSARRAQPIFRQIFVGVGDRHRRVHRSARLRAQALRDPQAPRAPGRRARLPPARRRSTSSACPAGRASRRACSPRRSCAEFFLDLRDPDFESALALVHQRFSTNTFPSWQLAHPYRVIAHNGEINTLRGNINWMRAREGAALVADCSASDLQEDVAGDPRGRQRLGHLRQRARVPGHERAAPAARDADADPRGVGRTTS